jgi:4-hydroxy-3-methylbut-2-enyl diphosphate reductase IspH
VLLYGPEDVKGKMSELAVEGEIEKVGITGATSTPRWLMEAVAENLRW